MPTVKRPSLPVIAVVMLFLVVLAGFVPAMISNTQGSETKSISIAGNESVTLKEPLETSAETVNNSFINVSVTDTDTGDTASVNQLNRGDTASVSVNSNSINITYSEYIYTNTAIVIYEYPVFPGWNPLISSVITAIVALLLTVFLYMIFTIIAPGDES